MMNNKKDAIKELDSVRKVANNFGSIAEMMSILSCRKRFIGKGNK